MATRKPCANSMTEIIDASYFTELKTTTPERLCRNNRCEYLANEQQYTIKVWGDQYLIDLQNSRIENIAPTGPPPHEYFYLFIIYYLLQVKDVPLVNEWISEKDLPGGPTFFRGPHLVPTEIICRKFGNDIQAFSSWCEKLGGIQIEMADAAFRFEITPDIPVAVLYWIGDEDFPAEAKILYDRSIIEQLTLDILFALAVGVCVRIGAEDSNTPT